MNARQRRTARRKVAVERGFGPRHAFNAQEGSEAVPSELPTPPVAPETLGGRLFDELRRQAVPDEVIEEIRRNPTGAKAMATYASLGIMLMPEGGGKRAMELPRGAVPHETWLSWKPAGGTEGSIRVDPAGNHYEFQGTHTDLGAENAGHVIVQPVEAPGEVPKAKRLKDISEMDVKQVKSDPQFPSLNKPPYDVLKEFPKDEGFAPGEPGSDLHYEKWLEGKKFKDQSAADDAYWQHIGASDKAAMKEFLDKHTHDFEVQDDMTLKKLPPEEEPPFEPNVPRFKKGTTGVRHNPKTHTGRPKKIGVEKGFGPRHGANAKEGEDLTAINTDTVPAMLTPREAVLNRNAAELAGRGAIEKLNAEGNALAKKGVDLAAEGDEDVPYPMRLPLEGAQVPQAEAGERYEELMQELEEALRRRGVPPLRGLSEGEESKDTGHQVEGYRILAAGGESEVPHLQGGTSGGGNQPRVDQWLIDYMANLRANQPSGTITGGQDYTGNAPSTGGVDIPPADMKQFDPGAIGGGPFQGWTPENMAFWHGGAGPGTSGYPSFEGNTAGPGGSPLTYNTTSYNVPGYGWVPHANLANSQASNNFWDYMNPFGGTTKGGSGTGVPTQKAVGTIAGTLTNVLVPGLGFVTGPIARWITSKIQGGMSHDQAVQAARDAGVTGTSEPPPMPQGSVDLPGGGGRGDKWHDIFGPRSSASGTPGVGVGISPTGAPAVGREWWSNDFGRWDLGASGLGAGGPNSAGGPGLGLGHFGTGFGSGTVGNFNTAIGFDRLGAGSGPSNLNWTAGSWGDDAREHFNPYFGGYSADKQAGGPGVKLRAKGDSDVEEESMNTNQSKQKPQRLQGGGMAGGTPPYGWQQHQANLATPGWQPPGQAGGLLGPPETLPGHQQMPYGWKQHQRNLGNTTIPGLGGGGGGFYPQGQGFYAGGTSEVGISDLGGPGIGANFGAAPQLSAPGGLAEMVAALKKEAQKQGLSASQISGIMQAFQGMGGGGMASYGEGSGVSNALGPALEGAFAGGYQGGISEVGYAPFASPRATFDPYRGWVGSYDPTYMIPAY